MIRKRAGQEFEATPGELGPQLVTLDGLVGGYNGFVDPSILSPQFWAGASNCYAGLFQAVRRARMAPVVNSTTPGITLFGFKYASMFGYSPIGVTDTPFLIIDLPGAGTTVRFLYSMTAHTIVGASIFFGTSVGFSLNGPVMRAVFNGFIANTNGGIRAKEIVPANGASLNMYLWGMDAPDVSPQIALSSGATASIAASPTGAVRASNGTVTITTTAPHPFLTQQYVAISGVTDTSFNSAAGTAVQITVTGASTFTFQQTGPAATSGSGTVTLGITKTVGRSYQWAWENANVGHVSAPSPASQFVKYASQIGTIDLIQPGTVTTSGAGSNRTITGVGTSFSAAWIGRSVWLNTVGTFGTLNQVISVASATSMVVVVTNSFTANAGPVSFQVYDPQATNIKLYATGDAASVYFLVGRNTFNPTAIGLSTAGLEFNDTANAEPPNAPFSNEIVQNYNVPPPIGSFLAEYQGRPIVYGVPAAPQSFFYGNMETTVVGQPPESFAPLNQITLPIGEGALKGMANLPTGLIIWSNRQDMFKLTGLLQDNSVANQYQLGATIQRLPYRIGCASPYATAVTNLGTFWLSSDREVWLFTDHYAPKNVGKPIQDFLNRINGARLGFARMKNYKSGDRNWLCLAVALDGSTFNNKLLILDLDLLSSNGQASYFTFDMATNQPTWYPYDVNCESIEAAFDGNSINHLLVGDTDLVTDVDWQSGYYTVGAEQSVTGNHTTHALGNENPEVIKTVDWFRAMTNQLPNALSAQGWLWNILTYDDDTTVLGNTSGNVLLTPGTDSLPVARPLEYSQALFRLGAVKPTKGRRFQFKTTFPTGPGLFELRGFQVQYQNIVAR